MEYNVVFDPAFEDQFTTLNKKARIALMERVGLLGVVGPELGRPQVGKLQGSKHSNMKELRFDADRGKWRVAFAFDPERKAVLLVAGDKAGVDQKRFYKSLIATADKRYDQHLKELNEGG